MPTPESERMDALSEALARLVRRQEMNDRRLADIEKALNITRAPEPQAGFCVVFVPFKNGKPSGNYEMFASGFPGKDVIKGPNEAKYRPCGLAQGPDGALYVSDDVKGKIWKVTYKK